MKKERALSSQAPVITGGPRGASEFAEKRFDLLPRRFGERWMLQNHLLSKWPGWYKSTQLLSRRLQK
jgi:hypothetical protein